MLRETDGAIKRIDTEVETIEQLKRGEAPPVPQLTKESEKAAEITGEPVIKTIEVSDSTVSSSFRMESEWLFLPKYMFLYSLPLEFRLRYIKLIKTTTH